MKQMAIAILAVAALATGSALAHTELTATVPADGATLAEGTEMVELSFSAPVRLTALSIQQDSGQKLSLGPQPAETTREFSVALPATTASGHYVVSWRAFSEDTHVVTGEFIFAVGAATTDATTYTQEAISTGAPATTPAAAPSAGASHSELGAH
jgi:methionine-rich copper-binding protein CopC